MAEPVKRTANGNNSPTEHLGGVGYPPTGAGAALGPSANPGPYYVPAALNNGGTMVAIETLTQSSGLARLLVLDGTTTADLGPLQTAAPFGLMSFSGLTNGVTVSVAGTLVTIAPPVALGFAEKNDPTDGWQFNLWWAHPVTANGATTWTKSALTVFDPAQQQQVRPWAYQVRANDRLEMVLDAEYFDETGFLFTVPSVIRNERIRPLAGLVPASWTVNATQDINKAGVILATAAQVTDANGNAISNPTPEPVLLVPAGLYVDANHDGTMDVSGQTDATSQAHPFTFWLNDDIDVAGAEAEFPDVQDDLDPTSGAVDWTRDTIHGTRDLEDFARIWLNFGALQGMITSGQISLGLKWTNVTEGTPAIKLFQAYEADGGAAYLTSTTVASAQVTGSYGAALVNAAGSTTLIEPTSGDWDFVIPTAALGNFSASSPTTHFLFEGCKRGKGQLSIVLLKNNGGSFTKMGDGPGLWLDLRDIKEMYERWTVGDGRAPGWYSVTGAGGGGPPDATATISTQRPPAGGTGLTYHFPLQSQEQNSYILFVHGWNLHPWEKDWFAETAFKRLYWQGYQGRFGTFQWPTTYHNNAAAAIFDFDDGEYSAWQSATPLKNLLSTLTASYSGNVYMFAHSHGNIVAGEALRLAAQAGGSALVKSYVATQAAVPVHCYDPSQDTPDDFFQVPYTPFTAGPNTPNIYNGWFTPNGAAAGTRANFYNPNDYALQHSIWETDQILKPDFRFPAVYYYNSFDLTSPPAGLFKTALCLDPLTAEGIINGHTGPVLRSLQLGDAANATTSDRYEIMAYAAEPRCRALGTTAPADDAGLTPQPLPKTLGGVWPDDTLDQPHGPYSSHPWHSAEFRFTNVEQKDYWKALLGPKGFDLLSP